MWRLVGASLVAAFLCQPAFAGKIEDVKTEVKKICSKDVDDKEALGLVKKAFLTCTPGQDVDVAGDCRIKCLKQNTGAVVGG